jgi:hypothetical protein
MLSASGGQGNPAEQGRRIVPAIGAPSSIVPGSERYCWSMTELLDTAGGIALLLAVVVVIGFAAYLAFGPQAIGLPALIGVLTTWGLASVVSNAGLGPVGIVVIVGGVVVVLLIIGMAMRFGADPSTRVDPDRPGEDS